MSESVSIRLSGRAARFLALLREFGHIDDERENDIIIALSDVYGSDPETVVDLPAVKRMAATWLFGELGDDLADGKSVIAEDWNLLFS